MATAEEFYGCLLSAVRAASSLWAYYSDIKVKLSLCLKFSTTPLRRIPCLIKHNLMKTQWRMGCSSMHSEPRRYKEVNGQLHASAALPLEEDIPVAIG
jgi:hypothetical protein